MRLLHRWPQRHTRCPAALRLRGAGRCAWYRKRQDAQCRSTGGGRRVWVEACGAPAGAAQPVGLASLVAAFCQGETMPSRCAMSLKKMRRWAAGLAFTSFLCM